TNATDIGGRGCYVESLLPLQLGTKVNIKFWMDEEKVQTSGVIRASDPGVGMGIEFTALDNTVQERLQAHLDKLDDGLASRDAAKGASTSET
ncbi:MAG: PilZ domain-containing protein, partial [Terriglobales bacterium]